MSLNGHWVSGFTDGEGCFYLCYRLRGDRDEPECFAAFTISLREDDTNILNKICEYFECGSVKPAVRYKTTGNAKPTTIFRTSKLVDLRNKIIPHFQSFPLQSKKQRDFTIWKDAVDLMWEVRYGIRLNLKLRSRGKMSTRHNWLPNHLDRFIKLVDLMKSTREYIPFVMTTKETIS